MAVGWEVTSLYEEATLAGCSPPERGAIVAFSIKYRLSRTVALPLNTDSH